MTENDRHNTSLAPYGVLIQMFVNQRMTADEFESVFLRLYKLDPTSWTPDLFSILDTLFGDIDNYCSDAALRMTVGGFDAEQLRERAEVALSRLAALTGGTDRR